MSANKLPELDEVLWMCRRGMLELDLLLNNFARTDYNNLDDDAKQEFITLLSYDDPVLYDLLVKKTIAAKAEVRKIVAKINSYDFSNQ